MEDGGEGVEGETLMRCAVRGTGVVWMGQVVVYAKYEGAVL